MVTQNFEVDPFRIIVTCAHDEVLRPEDIDRFRKLGIVANFTPSWNGGSCGSDPGNMQRLLGPERGLRTLQSRTVFDTGAIVSFSSDEVELHRMDHWSPFWGMEVDPYRLHEVAPERVYIRGKLQHIL